MKALLIFLLAAATAVAPTPPALANIVEVVSGAAEILVPAAASAPGANGTFFRSDLTIWNLRSVPQTVALRWLPQAGSGAALVRTLIIPARSAIGSEDFVADILGITGVGSVVVTGVNSGGAPDSEAKLYAAARVWTPQPGSTGTTSQMLPTVATSSVDTSSASILGLRRDERFRTNVGIVNLDPENTQTFEVEVPQSRLGVPPEIYIVTVPPREMQLISLNATLQQPLVRVEIFNTTASAQRSDRWLAYGSSVDNTTGDAWSQLAVGGTF